MVELIEKQGKGAAAKDENQPKSPSHLGYQESIGVLSLLCGQFELKPGHALGPSRSITTNMRPEGLKFVPNSSNLIASNRRASDAQSQEPSP